MLDAAATTRAVAPGGIDLDRMKDGAIEILSDPVLPSDLVIGESFGTFERRELPKGERIFGCALRGQLVLLNAITNGMKSTVLKLAMICAVIGRPFPPFVTGGLPLKAFFLDFEGVPIQERDDIQLMISVLSEQEKQLVRENLFIACGTEIEIDGAPLCMSNPLHFEAIKRTAIERGVDVLVVDTFGSAFNVANENDNAEIKEKVMKPLKQLSGEAHLVTAMSHHIGKAKSEEGSNRVESHRGRGASSFADLSSSVFSLDYDRDQGTVLIAAAKVKGVYPEDVSLKLDAETRWLKPMDHIPVRSNYQDVLDLWVGDELLKTADIIKALAGRVSDRTIKRVLRDAKENGDLYSPRNGQYGRVRNLEEGGQE